VNNQRTKFPVAWTGKGKFHDADGKFSNSVYFNWNDGKLHFGNNWADNANQNFGSASGNLSF